MDTTHTTPELFAALALAQGEIENASKNAANPHFRSKYADLAEVLNTIRPPFAKHGLSLIQSPSYDGSLAHVSTLLAHSSGGYIIAVASCQPAKSDAQGIGAATTYLRRYGAAAVAGIAQEDDDGNAAAHSDKPAAVPNVSPQESAFADAIDKSDAVKLEVIGAQLAASGLDDTAKARLRTRYSTHKHALTARAAA